jgi:hypothetical protein
MAQIELAGAPDSSPFSGSPFEGKAKDGKMRILLNNGRTIAVSIRHGRGSDTAAPPKARRKNKSSTRGTQEEHKRNTREHFPISWLALGLYLA